MSWNNCHMQATVHYSRWKTLQKAYPRHRAMHKTMIWDLEQLLVTHRTLVDIDSDQGIHFASCEVQEWADRNDTLAFPPALQPHCCRLIERLNGLLNN